MAAPNIQAKVNTRHNKSRGEFPLFTLYGFQPKLSSSELPYPIPIYSDPAKRFYQEAEKLTKAKYNQIIQANKHRREAPNYKINDQVILATKNLAAAFYQFKFASKWIGPFKLPTSFLKAKMSHLTYQNSLTSNISTTPSTHHSSSHTHLTRMRSFQPENWTNLAQLKVTDGKLNKSNNSDSHLKLGNPNMKLNEKVMNTKTIAESMVKILLSS